ncbi:MAG TPA: hypothetical protein VEK80_06465 [Kribbellaceae bacterium]|nr:hypothetical protein [Kribbellaceae bacterium]
MSDLMTKLWVSRVVAPLARSRPAESERGDVPGWVLITLMTAGLVAALLAVARPQLTAIFERAMDLVNP